MKLELTKENCTIIDDRTSGFKRILIILPNGDPFYSDNIVTQQHAVDLHKKLIS